MPELKKKALKAAVAQTSKSVSIAYAKAHFSSVVSGVQKKRTAVTVLRRGVPVAQITPFGDTSPSLFGSMRGTVQVLGDIVGPTGVEWNLKEDTEDNG